MINKFLFCKIYKRQKFTILFCKFLVYINDILVFHTYKLLLKMLVLCETCNYLYIYLAFGHYENITRPNNLICRIL